MPNRVEAEGVQVTSDPAAPTTLSDARSDERVRLGGITRPNGHR